LLADVKNNTFRTTVGAVLNGMHVPSTTLELGPANVADPAARDAGLQGCLNALSWAGCLPHQLIEPLDQFVAANVNLGNLHRVLSNYPRAPCTGIVDYAIPAGATFKKGDLLATIRGMDGQRRAEVRAEIDGFVASWSSGVDKHEGQSLGMVGTPAGDTGAAVSWQFANGKDAGSTPPARL
jgi:predicted deacylase